MGQYVNESKHLFKSNSEIRDFDIILEKVSQEESNGRITV